jgi:hypothetical protein
MAAFMAQVVQHPLSKQKALSSNTITIKEIKI